MGLGKSFIKGPRFAYPQKQTACERCVWGTGEHSEDCPIRQHEAHLVESISSEFAKLSDVPNDPDNRGDRDRRAPAVHRQTSE
jgi:hypothetical protein